MPETHVMKFAAVLFAKGTVANFLFLTLAAFAPLSAMAEDVTGRIVNENLAPVRDATVIVGSTDSTCVRVALSDEEGRFLCAECTLPVTVTVQHMSYETFSETFSTSDVGDIILSAKENFVDEVVIVGEKPYVRVENDMLAYDTEGLIKGKVVNNAWDLVGKLSGVSLSDETVSLIGAAKVTILINGNTVPFTGRQLSAMLSSMPAEYIAKVEVTYNANPEYHVNGAIVNLVVRQPDSKGAAGRIAAKYRNRYYTDGGFDGNVRFSTEKATMDLMYGINRRNGMQYVTLESDHVLDGVLHGINQTERIGSKSWEHDIRASMDYRPTDGNSVNVTYTAMLAPSKKNVSRTTGNFQGSINRKNESSGLHDISINAKTSVGLSAGVDYTRYVSHDGQNLYIDYADGGSGMALTTGRQEVDRLAVNLDRTHTLKNGWNIGYGVSYMYSYDRDSLFYNAAEGMNSVSDTRAKTNEHTADAYFSVSKQFAKGLALSASIKGEYYRIEDYKKWALFPQFSLSYMLNSKNILRLGLSTDKIYPGYWAMQSSVTYVDGYSEIQGSPGIRPYTNYSLNAAYIYGGKYVAGVFFQYADDFFAQSPYQAPDRLALIYKIRNWNYMEHIGVNATAPVRIGERFETRLTLAGIYLRCRCDDFYDIAFDRKKFAFTGRMDNSFNIGKNLVIELDANIQTPVIQGTFDTGLLSSVDAGAKWNFAKNKMSLSVMCKDMFNTSEPKLTVDFRGQSLVMDTGYYSRQVTATLTCNLGGFKKKEEKEIDTSRFGH